MRPMGCLNTNESNLISAESTDEEIILATLNGDGRAYTFLVQRYQDQVATICMNMLQDHNTAVEVGQEVFIRLYRSLKDFRGEAGLKTYISRIAMNLSLNKLKQRNKWWERFSHQDELLQAEDGTDGVDVKLANKELIGEALKRLNERQRALITLRMVEGYSVKETATILDLQEGTVMSGLKRALDRMKLELNKLGYHG